MKVFCLSNCNFRGSCLLHSDVAGFNYLRGELVKKIEKFVKSFGKLEFDWLDKLFIQCVQSFIYKKGKDRKKLN